MTLYLCGDSTAASYTPDKAPIIGWGQVLPELLPDLRIVNAAMAGRSTKSFLSEGRLIAIEKTLSTGDLLLIQFTHNDSGELCWRHTDPYTSFASNLGIFVDTARLHGATPVIMTPICRRIFENGQFCHSHGAYLDAIRLVALQKNVPLIDIYPQSTALVRQLGDEESKKLYMNFPAGAYPAYPDGSNDNTHTRRPGAEAYARMAADGLRALKLI